MWGAAGLDRKTLTVSMKARSEEHTSELQSQSNLVCRLLLGKKDISCSRTLKSSSEPACPGLRCKEKAELEIGCMSNAREAKKLAPIMRKVAASEIAYSLDSP